MYDSFGAYLVLRRLLLRAAIGVLRRPLLPLLHDSGHCVGMWLVGGKSHLQYT
jgi:hypothetical protein